MKRLLLDTIICAVMQYDHVTAPQKMNEILCGICQKCQYSGVPPVQYFPHSNTLNSTNQLIPSASSWSHWTMLDKNGRSTASLTAAWAARSLILPASWSRIQYKTPPWHKSTLKSISNNFQSLYCFTKLQNVYKLENSVVLGGKSWVKTRWSCYEALTLLL